MKYRFGVCHEDYHYVVNLMEYVNSSRESQIAFVAFSSMSAVQDYLKSNYLDGLLIGEEIKLSEEQLEEYDRLAIMALLEEQQMDQAGIYKYQSGDGIVRDILGRLNVNVNPFPVKGKQLCAVYSPEGRCGKTSLAKGLGVKYPGSLCFSFEEFGVRESMGEEILYLIKVKSNKLYQLIEKLPFNDHGFKEIKGILSYMDIRQLDIDNMTWLKEQLLIGGGYERVIFDIGAGALSDLNVLKVMDRIYVPVLEGDSVKLQAFRELLRSKEYIDVGSKVKYVSVPICHYASKVMMDFIEKEEL